MLVAELVLNRLLVLKVRIAGNGVSPVYPVDTVHIPVDRLLEELAVVEVENGLICHRM